jgi:tetratricopeptide (TPR) repeat protein
MMALSPRMLVVACALLGGQALAEPRPATEKDKQIAGELVKKAIARSQVGDHSAAIDIYLQAYTIVPNPTLLSNLGSEYQQSGRPKEALRYFCMYLDKEPAGANAPYATSQAKILQAQLGNKNVDDDDVCKAKKPRPHPPVTPIEDEPPPRREPPPELVENKPVRDPATVIEREGTTSQGSTSSMRIAALATGVAGIAGLGVGIWAGVQAKTISDEITHHPVGQPWPNDIKSIEQSGKRYQAIQIPTMIAGGALLATGAILFVFDRADHSDRHDRSALRVVPTANGVAVHGQF